MYGEISPDTLAFVHDFTRCVKPDGGVYGTAGQCRKGVESAKETRSIRRESVLKSVELYQKNGSDALNKNLKTLEGMLLSKPGYRTPLTESALTALRYLRLKSHLEKKAEQTQQKGPLQSQYEELGRNSPKYTQTPGSNKPLPKATVEKEIELLEKELDALKKKVRALGEPSDDLTREKLLHLQKEGMDLGRNLSNARKGNLQPPVLSSVYERQGFNARPEVVATRSELESRKDIARNPDGRPIVAYRGISSDQFSLQFKGGGPDGDKHFPGSGIYGSGSYSASSPLTGNVKHDKWAQDTAKDYSGESGNKTLRVSAFAFRSDARLVQFEGEGKQFSQWEKETLTKARETTGYDHHDVGSAAASLGIHAYRVPQTDGQDFWVVLNRGAIIVANDPELTPD